MACGESTPSDAPAEPSVGPPLDSGGSGGTPTDPVPAGGNDAPDGGGGTSGGAAGGSEDIPDPPSGGMAGAGGSTGGAVTGGAGGEDPMVEPMGLRVVEVSDIAEVWSGHPVGFALVTSGNRQFAAYYDSERRMTVASRDLGTDSWQHTTLGSVVGWDSHNYIAMAVDADGFIHVSGNMHVSPLVYFRSNAPLDASTFSSLPMTGMNEGSTTYPEFFTGPSGDLVFAYRDGGSGNGNQIFNVYDTGSKTWDRVLDTPLTDGQGARNAYPVGPIQGPLGQWHMVWVWRDTPDASTNHDLSYARTSNLINWEAGSGQALSIPVTLAGSDIVDPVPSGGGMINNNTKIGFDSQNRPVIVYHKFDQQGNTQLYNARLEDGNWVVYQTTDWDYRWDFGGGGTLVFAIEVDGVKVQPDGSLTQVYYHQEYGGWGAFRLNEDDLSVIEEIEPPLPYPAELDEVESPTPEMVTRWAQDTGEGPDPNVKYMLRWETLPSNRDMPRDVVPPPTALRLYAVDQGG